MDAVLFTKLFGSRSLDAVGEATSELGFDGVDLLIRTGATVDPADTSAIAGAVKRLTGHGLSVPMATTDLTDPSDPSAAAILGACADAGIKLVRLGYWKYNGTKRYQEIFDGARRDLDGLATIASNAGIGLAIQLHGNTIHASGPLTKALLDGHDPQHISAYPDPGNQTVQDGRDDWRLTFDVLEPWLTCVGVKNGGWFPARLAESGQRLWASDWLGVADGMVPWHDIVGHLTSTGYAGLLSFHSHYEIPYPQVLDQTGMDLRYVRSLLDGAAK